MYSDNTIGLRKKAWFVHCKCLVWLCSPSNLWIRMKVSPAQSAALLVGGTSLFFSWETYRGTPRFYSNILMPVAQKIVSPENAHKLFVKFLSWKMVPRSKYIDSQCLHTKLWNREFQNPVGIAAGFDKHAEAMGGLEKMGFGFIEVGSITPLAQKGNPKPRVFRLSEDSAVINRYGFNSCGHEDAVKRLKKWKEKGSRQVILGINLGKNKDSTDHIKDYTDGLRTLGSYADYVVINVSSPNTPGLRQLQKKSYLEELCIKINEERCRMPQESKPALLIKIAPMISEDVAEDIADICLNKECGISGLVISNTTVLRPETLKSADKSETGGLSGTPLKEMSTNRIKIMYRLTKGKVPIIGVGGVSSGKDAYEKICAGASLVQIYTALVYHGPPVVEKVKRELAELVEKDGFNNVGQAIGKDHAL